MENLKPLQQIDHVLKVLRNDRGHIDFYDLYRRLGMKIGNGQVLLIDGDVLLRILEKLVRDKYVYEKPSDDGIKYAITIEGVLFHGYEKQNEIDDLNFKASQNNAVQAKIYADRLLGATLFAGIVGLLVLIFYIFQWFYPHKSDYPYYWIWEKIPKNK